MRWNLLALSVAAIVLAPAVFVLEGPQWLGIGLVAVAVVSFWLFNPPSTKKKSKKGKKKSKKKGGNGKSKQPKSPSPVSRQVPVTGNGDSPE